MSLLSEVISSIDRVEVETINKKIPEIIINISKLKEEVINYIENVYVLFSRTEQTDLLERSNKLATDLKDLQQNIENVNKNKNATMVGNITTYSTQLEEAVISLNIVSKLMEIHEGLQKTKSLQLEKLFVQGIHQIIRIQGFIQSIPDDESFEAILELNLCVVAEVASFLNELNNICLDNIITNEDKQTYILKFKKPNDDFNQALLALTYYKSEVAPLHKLGTFLWTCVFTPIINCKTNIKVGNEDEFQCLYIEVDNLSQKDNYKDVFDKLSEVLTFLSNNFNYQLQDSNTTLSYIGNQIKQNLIDLLIKNCLSETIPSSTEELQNYNTVVQEINDLQAKFISCKIFQDDSTSLLDYANNVDILFINKKCNDYMHYAISLMKKDLHEIIEVGQPYDVKDPLKEFKTNEFPQSAVSSSTLDLLKLVEEIMDKAVKGSDVSAGRLYCTAQNILDAYGKNVLEHHQKLLQTIPQQVAIFYNNCMYISHQLMLWNKTYKGKLPIAINAGPVTFKDQPDTLRSLAEETFLAYVKTQIRQVEEILKDSGLSDTKSLEKLEMNTEKCIRQCLRQQELLKTVWQKVLPYTVYNKTLGSMLNAVCDFIIKTVVSIEDITSAATEQLVDVLKVILTRGPKLFTDPNEINLYVQNWPKLKELVMILNSGLVDINDRWADGKGPLALQFKPEEIKSLIRALFQNTDMRAAILAKIH